MTGRTPRPGGRRLARALAIAAMLAATCGFADGDGQPGPPGGGGVQAPVGTVVMIIRHGEKPDGVGTGPGMDAFGAPDDSSLTQAGYARAAALVELFAPTQGWPRPGIVQPRAIYAAVANSNGEGLRTRQTVAPLAQRLGLPVNTDFGKGDEQKLVARVSTEPGPTLICWQHGEIPAIAKAFGAVTPAPPEVWPDGRFDVIWTLTRTADGWWFNQLPEYVLPGDPWF